MMTYSPHAVSRTGLRGSAPSNIPGLGPRLELGISERTAAKKTCTQAYDVSVRNGAASLHLVDTSGHGPALAFPIGGKLARGNIHDLVGSLPRLV